MHVWRGMKVLIIFATIREKEIFYPPPFARDAETHIRRARAAAAELGQKTFG